MPDQVTCAVCGTSIPVGTGYLCQPCEDTPEPCPMGCGRTTDDVAGGPCSTCWDEAPRSADA